MDNRYLYDQRQSLWRCMNCGKKHFIVQMLFDGELPLKGKIKCTSCKNPEFDYIKAVKNGGKVYYRDPKVHGDPLALYKILKLVKHEPHNKIIIVKMGDLFYEVSYSVDDNGDLYLTHFDGHCSETSNLIADYTGEISSDDEPLIDELNQILAKVKQEFSKG